MVTMMISDLPLLPRGREAGHLPLRVTPVINFILTFTSHHQTTITIPPLGMEPCSMSTLAPATTRTMSTAPLEKGESKNKQNQVNDITAYL